MGELGKPCETFPRNYPRPWNAVGWRLSKISRAADPFMPLFRPGRLARQRRVAHRRSAGRYRWGSSFLTSCAKDPLAPKAENGDAVRAHKGENRWECN